MSIKTLDIRNILTEDNLGSQIAVKFHEWFILMQGQRAEWEELRKYLFATDTTKTSNSTNPWKNKTTIPKLCQTRDNLNSNYLVRLFPKRFWLAWLANNKDSASKDKRDSILNYMRWVVSQPQFKEEMAKLVLDYIDYGNCFAMPEWADQRINPEDGLEGKSGYVGPVIRRISPTDIVFNPTASSFIETPKIIRSFITMGELAKKLESISTDENREEYKKLFNYICDYRQTAQATQSSGTEIIAQDAQYQVDGFTSFRSYLASDYVEVLTFYGDLFDWDKKELLQNHVIMVVDRHKVIGKKPNPSYFGYPPIFNCGWRVRQDNLWAQGPLVNLVGMQYRVDHLENTQADVLDLIAFPTFKQKGYVEDWEYGPGARIVTSEEGDVEMMMPPFQVLQLDAKIDRYLNLIELIAGSPRESLGFRTPGEKTAFEVSRQENAASRIFSNKTDQFEEFEERCLNAMLELAKRMILGPQEINVFDDEFKLQTFMTLTADDITGAGRIKPIAARHFAEKAETIQNLTNFYSSALGADPDIKTHFSSIKTAQMVEDLLDLQEYGLYLPYVRITEHQDAQKLQNAGMEQTQMEAQTPHGLTPDDHSGPPSTPPLQPGTLEPI